MNNGVSQESSVLLDLASHVNRFAFDSFRSDNNKTLLSNFLHFNGNTRTGAAAAKRGVSLGGKVGGASVRFGNILNDFNRAVRFHCEKIPIGFASLRVGDGGDGADGNGNGEGNGVRVDECGGVENEGFRGNGVEGEKPKKVLILMSDTGGGHRASAEAIKAAFYQEFGDDYQVCFVSFFNPYFLCKGNTFFLIGTC